MREDGIWCEDASEVRKIATNYFKDFFKSQGRIQSTEIIDVVKT